MKKYKTPEYSYRPSIKNEEKELKRKALVYGAFSFLILTSLIFIGPSMVNGIGTFWQTINGQNKEANGQAFKQGESPELPPQLEPIPAFTNNDKIEVIGTGTDSHVVEIKVNGEKVGETLIGKDGTFNFLNINLVIGNNSIEVTSKSPDGVTSPTVTAKITYDKKAPKLDLNSPNSDLSVAKTTSSVTITGSSDPDATITINDFQTVVSPDGSFKQVVGINDGQNPVRVEASDQAGNKKEVKFVVTR